MTAELQEMARTLRLEWESATDCLIRKAERMRLSIDRCKQSHIHNPWSSQWTSTTPISVGKTTQQSINNPRGSLNALMINSFSK